MNEAAVCAGTFDPITMGHLDVIERASRIFPRIVLAVATNPGKNPLFSLEERIELVRESTAHLVGIEIDSFAGLLVDFAESKGVRVIVRGLRAFSDFEYEFQMALTNRKLKPQIETLFLMPKQDYSYVSSSNVREVAQLGGDTSQFVPVPVQRALTARFG
ncbi:pantetheine-phosphate adenylyltransferase [Pontiella sulfatireligans]|uniref:Phosphopantetheine adenylyltransferase n=1 Tax=Pontiella sulfatireligans TaxID=2750658 RepID=A0A6C2UNS5_9BACT|nr:pantetheine-phosphate adenylyltransferase [Pontiella sulfatireligans]VGO21838.1 Phosphopantetheine adenylyltransferase [Pontiella sulfatireligans]